MPDLLLAIEYRNPAALKPYRRNARTHPKRQLNLIADSIRRYGMVTPVGIGDDDELIYGHARVQAAMMLGLEQVPTVRLSHLSPADRRAYVISDNQLAVLAGWDGELLALELGDLAELDYELPALGFTLAEIDGYLDGAADAAVEGLEPGAEDTIPVAGGPIVTRTGDIWELGRHRLICGDARDGDVFGALLGSEKVDLVFTDPPYNVPIGGNVSGLGKITHREFAMASGEMSDEEFAAFLEATLGHAAAACRDGAIAFVCMDWRHMGELIAAGKRVFSELKNVCVWNKKVAGMGTFYRSKHEMVFAFKVGTAPHVNSFGLGDTGRYRTNVWDYAGVVGSGATGHAELEMHPTVKPVALIADAIRDCSKRGGIVLDPFGGSGSTLIAAERCGRKARLIEYDPHYCDTIRTAKEATVDSSSAPPRARCRSHQRHLSGERTRADRLLYGGGGASRLARVSDRPSRLAHAVHR